MQYFEFEAATSTKLLFKGGHEDILIKLISQGGHEDIFDANFDIFEK